MSTKVQNPARGRGEQGFALLVIFLLAASIALMLYMQMPRVAFEAQRDKEQLLIDRGEQYKRAIQMYFVQFKKYPSSIDDLESTNNMRFLRRRYIDPMTGKADWRLIHVDAAGNLTDSLVEKPPAPAGTSGASGASGASGGSGGSGASGASGASGDDGPTVNAAVFQRPSDRALTPTNGQTPATVDPNDPRYWPPMWLTPSGATGQAGAPVPGMPGAIPGQPGAIPGQLGTIPGQPGAIPGQPGAIPTGQLPGQLPGQFPGQFPGLPGGISGAIQSTPPGGQVQLAGQPGAVPNPAVSAINQMLTQPRQSGPSQQNGSGIGAGLAGVASLFKGPSIKVYNDQQKYQKWEFIFKLNNGQPGAPGAPPGGQGTPNSNGQTPGGANPGSPQTPITPSTGASPGAPSSGQPLGN